MRQKAVFTTGEAAKICKLSQQTIIRCFDSGRLEGFRVPGSRFRRIPRDSLIKFMKANDIPLDGIEDGKARVLVVDDDPEIIDLLTDALEGDGRFEVSAARTGYDAGLMTQQIRPAVLLLDYELPDVNGEVVCSAIRNHPELGHTKIIVISGRARSSDVDRLLAAGADDFIQKPFDIKDLVDRVAQASYA